jgi:hypothetical protein
MAIEFDCAGCGYHIFNPILDTPPADRRCYECTFLDEHVPDPVEREAVRRLLNKGRENAER